MCEVICSDREEICILSEFFSHYRACRDLDHHTDFDIISNIEALFDKFLSFFFIKPNIIPAQAGYAARERWTALLTRGMTPEEAETARALLSRMAENAIRALETESACPAGPEK